ncbi:MAG: hypothetical protein RLZZ609_1985 [Cyanobacteriota bacterium]|jgi:hypothetical protein
MALPRMASEGPLGRLGRLALGCTAALVPLLSEGGLQAAPPPAYRPDVYPPSEVFRRLQLTTLACSRENAAERCDEARRLADPLLDHPLLPARCKDVLWSIRNLAVAAPANSLARREPIDQSATEVTVACRQLTKAKPVEKPQGPAGGGLLQFGGGQP